nr:immunoglobulin heavy chain junction region [Macaca mulatta]MOX60596.1 immunoglobulin heavy chain junction region [Macaca mulatta]MOX61526.1 immunoglobulin heavy chain junction region [Macaca mulatta]MOX61906.1 immunoglobulin heavy chain junction region [Macaca mulatta]MOX62079.1 immunoglobulin heavy chain junction region [Macaca mulatta]
CTREWGAIAAVGPVLASW